MQKKRGEDKMKILMINGTMRKGSTYQVGKLAIEEIMQEGDQLTELFLPKDMPEFCRGCAACIRESERDAWTILCT